MATKIVEQFTHAKAQRAALEASLPSLRKAAAETEEARTAVAADLERAEGDALVGLVSESALVGLRQRHETAVLNHRKAEATARKAQDDLTRLDHAIARLGPEAHAVRVAHYKQEQIRLATLLADALAKAAEINAQLDRLYADAEREFPHTPPRRSGAARGYPVAAGLTNLAWPELRHEPYAPHGGRVGMLRQDIADLRHPPVTAPVRRASPVAPSPQVFDGPWRPLNEGRR